MRTFRMASMLVLATALTSLTAFAQPRHPKNPPPPPPPQQTMAAPASPDSSDYVEGGTIQATTDILPKESEVRRGFRFGGFVDPEFSVANKTWYQQQGFTVNDGALYIEKDFGRGLSGLLDFAFGPGFMAGATASTNLNFASGRSQAFVQYQNGAFLAKLGQFDTIFGVEKNDSRDRFFANNGAVKFLLPLVHDGVLLSYNVLPMFAIRAVGGDYHDTGSMTSQNPEFGLQARFDNQKFFAAAGVLYNDLKAATTNSTNLLIDANAGLSIDHFNGAIYFSDVKVATVDKHRDGFGLLGSFGIQPDLAAGARVEYLTDPDPTYKSKIEFAVGPNYKWSSDVTLRGDFSLASWNGQNSVDDVTVFGGHFSIVAGF